MLAFRTRWGPTSLLGLPERRPRTTGSLGKAGGRDDEREAWEWYWLSVGRVALRPITPGDSVKD